MIQARVYQHRPQNKGRNGRNDLPRMYPFGSDSYVHTLESWADPAAPDVHTLEVLGQTRVISPRAPKRKVERQYICQQFCYLTLTAPDRGRSVAAYGEQMYPWAVQNCDS